MAAGHEIGKDGARIVVVGDRGTGKSSLIAAAVSNEFPTTVPQVLPPSRLPDTPVSVTVVDMSSRKGVTEELKRADAVVLTYAFDLPESLDHLRTFWLPKLRRLEVKVPLILVGCKFDLRNKFNQFNFEQVIIRTLQEFREIESLTECSAFNPTVVRDVFHRALNAALYPERPLFNRETRTLRPRCIGALKRIFMLCDQNGDGALSDSELSDYKVKCLNTTLAPADILGLKRFVQKQLPEGVNENGLTLTGFLFLHLNYFNRGRQEMTWMVLRKFGYTNDIKLNVILPPTFKRAPDQSVELTDDAIDFLKRAFSFSDIDKDGILTSAELDDKLFSTAPDSPWNEAPYRDTVAPSTARGGISVDGFLSQWALMTRLDPARSMEYLKYVLYRGDAASALRITRKRCIDLKQQQSHRNVFQCFVFGPKEAGKSALLNSFLSRPFSERYISTSEEQYAVGVVDEPGGTNKTLVLREVPEEQVEKFLSVKNSLADCDIAIFIYDSSNQLSWIKAAQMITDVVGHGLDSGYEVPFLIVATKNDLDPYPTSIHDSTQASQDMGVEAPISVSAKSRDLNNIFHRIVHSAQHPHLSIPQNIRGRIRKHYPHVTDHSHRFVPAGATIAAVAIVVLAVYMAYAVRRNASKLK